MKEKNFYRIRVFVNFEGESKHIQTGVWSSLLYIWRSSERQIQLVQQNQADNHFLQQNCDNEWGAELLQHSWVWFLLRHIDSLTKSNIKIDKLDLPTFYWLPKLHKNPYKSRFISNSSHCSTTILSKHITPALTAVKDHVIKYSETAFSNSNVNYFWSIKNSSEVIEKLRVWNFQGSQVSSFDFSTLYTSLPHDLIKAKVLSLVKWCFDRESKTYLCTSAKAGFFSNKKYDSYACWTCTELCEAFTFLMENIYVQFDGMVYQQIVGIPVGTNCAPLIADLFLYCYERDFMSNLQKSNGLTS